MTPAKDPQPEVLGVVGSRGFDTSVVSFAMDSYLHGIGRVVSGGARGVDRTAEEYAASLGLMVVSYRPRKTAGHYIVDKWLNGVNLGPVHDEQEVYMFEDFRTAAFTRNWWIVKDSTRLLALWDGWSSGTAHSIAAATRWGTDLRIWMDGDS